MAYRPRVGTAEAFMGISCLGVVLVFRTRAHVQKRNTKTKKIPSVPKVRSVKANWEMSTNVA
jgi:hypothetical protein